MASPPSTSSDTSSCALNIGILGHVDCGKTTLTRRIAEMGSTSAFDAHVASSGAIRRNTVDLGFSTMTSSTGRRLALIDCPGHSGLIRAVLAASTVFDMAVVVIDVTNGIQPQTAEHLLLVSKFCPDRVIVVLSKCDLADESKIEECAKKVKKGLKLMGVNENSPMIPMSLADGFFKEEMLNNLKAAIESKIYEPKRELNAPFLIAIDHCFGIKGQGTVLTGTVIQGVLRLNSEIEFCSLGERRRVKTLETWKQRVDEVTAGNRAAFLVSSPSIIEHRFSRCICGAPGTLKSTKSVLATVNPVQFFRKTIKTRSKIHVAVAFETVMAECSFLRDADNEEFEVLSSLEAPCKVLLSFEKAIFLPEKYNIPYMAARLEQQPGSGCRYAFSGIFSKVFAENSANSVENLPRFTRKCRKGLVERIEKDGFSAICTAMFKPETNFDIFRGFHIVTSSGPRGKIEGAFGKSGKFRVTFAEKIDGVLKEKEEIFLFLKKYHNDNKLISCPDDFSKKK